MSSNQVATGSTTPVYVDVEDKLPNGQAVDPTSFTVQALFLPASSVSSPYPTTETEGWVAGSWFGSNASGFTAQVLVGPNGVWEAPEPGDYALWLQISSGSEAVILLSGIITFT